MPRALFAAIALAAGLGIAGAQAQIAPPRTLDELKAETQARADRNAYPLTGLKPDDVREALAHIGSLDRDAWAKAWSEVAQRYMGRADGEAASDAKQAATDYMAAWRLYSFARWPVPNSPGKEQAYRDALAAFRKAAQFLNPPLEILRIPLEGKEIVGYLRLPKDARPAPLVFMISALDSRKEDSLERGADCLAHGLAVFAVDMPGTGEAPIKADVGAERMFSAALDTLLARPEIDHTRVVVQGNSWSGYWAAKLAVTERARIRGAVVQGGPVHNYFQADWQLPALGTREYLFDLFPARASVYGVSTLEEFLAYGPRLSLKDGGFLDQPSAPMLLVNGVKDTQVPIADLDLLLHTGQPKDAWVNPTGGHMGRNAEWPDGKIFKEVVLPWVVRRLSREG
ncbi:MAG TPA: alpha/beta fold hydrolase [Stellaceae bacterium]|nr:alpha/beta fold hydrolase [Stellaceae bacterium]